MALKQADRLESNNPKAYGIVRAIEVSGHRTVSSLENLYTIADCILSDSKKNTNNDALGQSWYVISEGITYYSDVVKTYSVVDMVEAYYTSGDTRVESLYNFFESKGLYA